MTTFRAPHDTAIATVTQPGSPYELGNTSINGIDYRSYVNAPRNLTELIKPAREHGDAEFLVYEGERWSFNDFFRQVDTLGSQLLTRFRVNKGDRIAIAMRNYPEWLTAYVAITAVGAVAVPLNSWGQARELQQNIEDAGVNLVFCDDQRLQLIDPVNSELTAIVARSNAEQLAKDCHTLEAIIADGAIDRSALQSVNIDAEDSAMIMYTSGTSGRPKGAIFSHRNCCQSITNFEAIGAAAYLTNMDAYNRHAQNGGVAKSLLTVPLFHVSGLFSQFLMNLRGGRPIVMMYKWNPLKACELIEQEGISVVMGAPSMLLELVSSEAFDSIDTGNLINISGGGAATPTKLSNLIHTKAPSALTGAGWGMTESGAVGTAFTGCFVPDKPGSSGFVNPIVQLRFCDEAGEEVTAGSPGEIWIKSPANISGYCNAPEANNSEFRDGWFKTGDIGYLDADGCMFICDRAKDLVIRGGENIYPVEVENCIQSLPHVERVAAFAVASEEFGEELAAVIKVAPEHLQEIDEETVQAHCRKRLAAFKVPSFIKFTSDSFPVNATSKVIKKQVRDTYFPAA